MQLPDLSPELVYRFSRSGGAGGQNVNKVSTKAELRFSPGASSVLTDEQKAVLLEKWANRLTTDGELVLTHQTDRTQLANKEKVTAKFYALLAQALRPSKPRRNTKPTEASIAKRIAAKKRQSDRKAARRRIDSD